MPRKKYRVCQLCNALRTIAYGTDVPQLCPCGGHWRTIDRQEWIDAIFTNALHDQENATMNEPTTTHDELSRSCACPDCCPECHEPTPDDLDAIASWSWSGYRAQLAEFGWIENGKRVFATAMTAALLALLPLTSQAQDAHAWHDPIPAGCSEVGHFEDGTMIATCGELGSKVIAFDADGQLHPGSPYRAPGTWHAIS